MIKEARGVRVTVVRNDGRKFTGFMKHRPDGIEVRTGKAGRVPVIAHDRVVEIKYPAKGSSSLVRVKPSTLLGLAVEARQYLRLVDRGDKAPVARLAKEQGRSADCQRQRLYSARKSGLLTTTGSTKPGGELTTTALRLLAEARA
jgi:hypothetical protein